MLHDGESSFERFAVGPPQAKPGQHKSQGRVPYPEGRRSGGSVPWTLSSRRDSVSDDIHYRVLRAIEANPEITQRELAEVLDMSLGKANYCVRALIEKGWI